MSNPEPPQSVNIWQYKPWWCQPWSIVLTGLVIIGMSWLLFHRIWLSVLVGIPITLWMVYFVLVYPKLLIESGYFQDGE